eukprot:TRINITY_DN1115_c0_g1_i2.p1 TRINITY_DN1115_c0_g1~~TRINITY_DN1115_c0_g1_i2.p1  ORF type:complete len:173 (-),score=24.71 TRINITY_DN1115_c0_g1_i2:98-565(-)
MDYFNSMFRKEEDVGFVEGMANEYGLSYTKRIFLFVGFFVIGVVFCGMSTMLLFSPTRFAKYYTLGTVFIMFSTFFLVGPMKQIKSMFHSSRFLSAMIYFGSMFATLYCAISLQTVTLTLILIMIQFASAIWYGASYVPFAQDCLRSTARTVLPI